MTNPSNTFAKNYGLTTLNYRLLLSIFLTLLVPTLYNTFRIYFISDIPNEWGFNIASQIAWLNILYEILQESIILPLFFVFGAIVANPERYYQKVKQAIFVVIPLYSIASLLIWMYTEDLTVFLSQKPDLIAITTQYIRLETIVIPLRVVSDILMIAMITLALKTRIYLFIGAQFIIRFVSDTLFIGHDIMDVGVLGVAYSSIVINTCIAGVGAVLLFYKPVHNAHEQNPNQQHDINWKKWLNVSMISGLESGIRNVAFIYMILKLVNEAEQSGILWVGNGFIWGWLLLPIMAISSLVKQDAGTHNGYVGNRFKGYLTLTALCMGVWLITMPAWGWFIANIMGIDDVQPVLDLVLLSVLFYVFFAFNHILDSYLYGIGRTDLMLYQTLFVNTFYYGGAFVLYHNGIFIPTLQSIALLFGGSLVLDFFVTVGIFYWCQLPKKQ